MEPLWGGFGISRVTGYKIFARYKESGLEGLHNPSRRPYRQANQLPYQVERLILSLKKDHPNWGAPKIRDKILREFSMLKPPAKSTIHAVLDRRSDRTGDALRQDLPWQTEDQLKLGFCGSAGGDSRGRG